MYVLSSSTDKIDLWTMIITTLHVVVIFSASMPKGPGGLVVRASNWKTQVQSLARTQIFTCISPWSTICSCLFLYTYTIVTCS